MRTNIRYKNGALIRSRHIEIAREIGLHILHLLLSVSKRIDVSWATVLKVKAVEKILIIAILDQLIVPFEYAIYLSLHVVCCFWLSAKRFEYGMQEACIWQQFVDVNYLTVCVVTENIIKISEITDWLPEWATDGGTKLSPEFTAVFGTFARYKRQ